LLGKVSQERHQLANRSGETVIVQAVGNVGPANGAVLSLIFAKGQRPGVDALAELGDGDDGGLAFSLSHIAPDGEYWAELLSAGLTYDCRGLSPGAPAVHPGKGALLGLEAVPQGEAVSLEPAPHLAEGPGMLPVVRILAGLGAEIARLPGLQAVFWRPAQCWMAADYFRRMIGNWLAGGAFPALGLTSLHRESNGTMVSYGLDLLIGQELRFEPDRALPPAKIARIAVRLIHSLIETGPLYTAQEFDGPEGEPLRIDPVLGGLQLKVSVRR
jgi:hypothetical protein